MITEAMVQKEWGFWKACVLSTDIGAEEDV